MSDVDVSVHLTRNRAEQEAFWKDAEKKNVLPGRTILLLVARNSECGRLTLGCSLYGLDWQNLETYPDWDSAQSGLIEAATRSGMGDTDWPSELPRNASPALWPDNQLKRLHRLVMNELPLLGALSAIGGAIPAEDPVKAFVLHKLEHEQTRMGRVMLALVPV